MKYSEIINSGWLSDTDSLRDTFIAWSDSVSNKVFTGKDGAICKTAFDVDYIARNFGDDYIKNEVLKRIPQKRLIEIYNFSKINNRR